MSAETGTEETKQANISKLGEVFAAGQKKLDEGDYDSAVELLSDATRLADTVYGPFAPESFDANMKYGLALLNMAIDELKANDDDLESSEGEDEEMHVDQPAAVTENGEGDVTAQSEADMTLKPEEEEPLEGVEEILDNAWSVLEVAKQICEKQLEKPGADVRKWKLNLAEPLNLLGRVLVLNGDPEMAKPEFEKAIEIKQQHLNDERALANNFHEIGDAFSEMFNFDDAKTYFTKALESFKKTVGSIEAAKGDKREIDALNAICKTVQDKIDAADESGKLILNFEDEVVNMNEKAKSQIDAPAVDVSHLIKRRPVDSGDKSEAPGKRCNSGLDESDAINAKKSKLA